MAKKNTVSKRNKREQREINKTQRVLIPWNTGTRTHETDKKYNRNRSKRQLRKEEY